MIKNYLKIAWRNLIRNKGFAFTNLLGLTIGITCTIFIFLWVKDEISFDTFHKNHDDIYQAMATRDFQNDIFTDDNMVFPLAPALQSRFPQIEYAASVSQIQTSLIDYKATKLKRDILFVNNDFLNIFSWTFLKGNMATALKDPSSIIITQSFAKAFFGDADPINQFLKIDNGQTV
jgi:putative ABC transport system permease protein